MIGEITVANWWANLCPPCALPTWWAYNGQTVDQPWGNGVTVVRGSGHRETMMRYRGINGPLAAGGPPWDNAARVRTRAEKLEDVSYYKIM